MKNLKLFSALIFCFVLFSNETGCDGRQENKTALDEQSHTEINQARLMKEQPLPDVTWSLERDNIIKRFKLQNDRSVMFYMYVFNQGVQDPIGYYQVNKVSSVNSQISNPQQAVASRHYSHDNVLASPAEDGSYGTNGNGVFGFTPEEIYIEHNMNYICATVPLVFQRPVPRLAVVSVETGKQLREMMDRINKQK